MSMDCRIAKEGEVGKRSSHSFNLQKKLLELDLARFLPAQTPERPTD
jgi:hypothetical protein